MLEGIDSPVGSGDEEQDQSEDENSVNDDEEIENKEKAEGADLTVTDSSKRSHSPNEEDANEATLKKIKQGSDEDN
jgi:hypothetical protein